MEDTKIVAEKALSINLNQGIFGTFAEIGAGQEVARHFFRVGAAAGTIAKSMSAYDMTFSDAIYGKSGRYVSKERLLRMLDHEYSLLIQRLSRKRGADTSFFAFANTVAAQSYKGSAECHGWMGVRFQAEPQGPPSNVIVHVRMLDKEAVLQQQVIGAIGTNLVFATFMHRNNPCRFLKSLIDELSKQRIEIDMIEFTGPAFEHIDNRIMALKLVEMELTDATMFAPDGQVLQPSEILYKRPVLIERGSFRPVTHVHLDMLDKSLDEFSKIPGVRDKDPVVLLELTVNNLEQSAGTDEKDFLARADSLSALGHTVLISDYSEHYRLPAFFRRYTKEPVGMVGGVNALLQVMGEQYYDHLPGGILEALGRLFAGNVTFYVYPMTREGYLHYMKSKPERGGSTIIHEDLPEMIGAEQVVLPSGIESLLSHLIANKKVVSLQDISKEHLGIFSREVLAKIRSGDPSWEDAVPVAAAKVIKERKIFDCKPGDDCYDEAKTESEPEPEPEAVTEIIQ